MSMALSMYFWVSSDWVVDLAALRIVNAVSLFADSTHDVSVFESLLNETSI